MRLSDIQGQLELLQRQQEGGGSNGWSRQAINNEEGVTAIWTAADEAGLMAQLSPEGAASSDGLATEVAGRPLSSPEKGGAEGPNVPQPAPDGTSFLHAATLPDGVPLPAPLPAVRLAPVFRRPDGSSLAEVLQLPLRGLLQEEDPGSPMYYKR